MDIMSSFQNIKSKNYNIVDTYEYVKEIGSGAFGRVWIAIRNRDNKKIALKIVPVPWHDRVIRELIDREIQTLIDLTKPECINPFVVCYYNSFYDEEKEQYYIEMEYIDGKEMFDFVIDKTISPTLMYRYLVLIARDISMGLKYVHDKGIIHNDIKLENIMIENVTIIPKIIDFGLSCRNQDRMGCNLSAGTKEYMSPEYVTSKQSLRLPASDMWALGIALYAGATKKFPYIKTDDINVIFNAIENNPSPRLNTPNSLLNDIVNGLLNKDPNQRLTPTQVINMVDTVMVGPPPSPTQPGYFKSPKIPPARTISNLNDSMELTPMRLMRPLSPSSSSSYQSEFTSSSSSGMYQ